MIKVKLTMAELARRAKRDVSAIYRMKKSRPAQYRLLVIGALAEMVDEQKLDEIGRML